VQAGGARIQSPFVALVGYTLQACLPRKRWFGVLLPCIGAVAFGWLSTLFDTQPAEAFGIVARLGLFPLVLPLTCMVIGDAVLGADMRAGTFPLTWLSPVPLRNIVLARWLGGWIVALVTLVPALVLAAMVGGFGDTAGAMALAGAAGSAAYIAVFVAQAAFVRRSALWALAVVFVAERLLGPTLSGVAQFSPGWLSQQVYAGMDLPFWQGWCDSIFYDNGCLVREGVPVGWSAVVRLAGMTVVLLVVATRGLRRLRPTGGDE
jgi:hypothetical protein